MTSSPSSKSTSYHARALSRGLEILGCLAASTRQRETLADLHQLTGLPKSTLVRLLIVLEEAGYVHRIDDAPTYRLGHAVAQLARGFHRASDVGELAKPYLRALAKKTNQTANIGVIDSNMVYHLCVQEPDRSLRFRSETGSRDSLHCTGLGKMLLAGLDDDLALALLDNTDREARTPMTLTATEDIMADVTRSRIRGYAVDSEEGDLGVCCIAVPIAEYPASRPWHASVSLSGPSAELSDPHRDRLVQQLQSCATAMSKDAELMAALDPYRPVQ